MKKDKCHSIIQNNSTILSEIKNIFKKGHNTNKFPRAIQLSFHFTKTNIYYGSTSLIAISGLVKSYSTKCHME